MKFNYTQLRLFVAFLYFVSMYIGSYFYLSVGFLSIMNIMLFITIVMNINCLLKARFNPNELGVLCTLFMFSFFAFIIGFFVGGDLVKNALYFFHGFNIYLIILLFKKNNVVRVSFYEKVIFIGVLILLLITIFQVLDILNILQIGIKFRNEIYGIKLITGTFQNPNDLSVVAFLSLFVYSIIGYFNKQETRNVKVDMFIYFAVLFLIVSSLSRTVFLLFIIGSFFYFKWLGYRSFNRFFSAVFLCSIMFLFVILYSGNSSFESSEIELVLGRIESIINVMLGEKDGSATSRLSNYIFSLQHLGDIPFYGFFEAEFNTFYSKATFNTEVYRVSPHSYILEVLLSYGFLGLSFVFLFIALIIRQFYDVNMKGTFKMIQLFFVFLLISFIPSSIIKLPIIYLLFMLAVMAITSTYPNSSNKAKTNVKES